jgi:hypothetical protein
MYILPTLNQCSEKNVSVNQFDKFDPFAQPSDTSNVALMVLKITRYSCTERSPVVLSRHVRIAISSAAFCDRFRDAIATRAGRALRLRFRGTTGSYNFLKADVMQGDEFVTVFVVEVGVSAVQLGIACCRS